MPDAVKPDIAAFQVSRQIDSRLVQGHTRPGLNALPQLNEMKKRQEPFHGDSSGLTSNSLNRTICSIRTFCHSR
jgi:hypothetical protein